MTKVLKKSASINYQKCQLASVSEPAPFWSALTTGSGSGSDSRSGFGSWCKSSVSFGKQALSTTVCSYFFQPGIVKWRKGNKIDLKKEFCLKFSKSYILCRAEHVMCTVEGCMYVLYIRVDWYINFCDFYKFNSEKSSCFYFQNITGTLKWILFLFNLQIQFTSTAKKKIQNITFKIFVKSPKMGKTIFYYCFLYCTMYIRVDRFSFFCEF